MVSKKVKKKILIEKNRHGIGKRVGYFRLGMGPKECCAPREGQKIFCHMIGVLRNEQCYIISELCYKRDNFTKKL